MASSTSKVVDIHTHMYPPRYVQILESRTSIPLIRKFPGAKDPRYIILPDEAESLDKITSDEKSNIHILIKILARHLEPSGIAFMLFTSSLKSSRTANIFY